MVTGWHYGVPLIGTSATVIQVHGWRVLGLSRKRPLPDAGVPDACRDYRALGSCWSAVARDVWGEQRYRAALQLDRPHANVTVNLAEELSLFDEHPTFTHQLGLLRHRR
jgi:hypothetical protein